MERSKIVFGIINQTQANNIKSIADQFATALILADEIYPKIPEGKWKEFFDEKIKFGIGLNTNNSFVFVVQKEKRIRFLENDHYGKPIFQKLSQRNFNLLIEALLYPFYENALSSMEGVDHKICVEVPENFLFTEKEFNDLQSAFTGYLKITKKFGPSSNKDSQQESVVFFEFSFWPKEEEL